MSALFLWPFASYGADVHDVLFTSLDVSDYSTLGLNINGTSGNHSNQTYQLQLNTAHRGKKLTWTIMAEIQDSRAGATKTDERETAQARMISHRSEVHGIEAYLKYDRDVLERLSRQSQIGVGYRYESKAAPNAKLSYALGAGVTQEQIRYTTSLGDEQNTRGNFYAASQTHLGAGNRSTLTLSAEVLPKLSDWSDWRGKAAMTLRAPITGKLAMTLQAEYDYDAQPNFGVVGGTMRYSTGVSYTF
ncbi:MAG: DUF481 domain-containing protein [Luteimonas sp.]